MRVVIVLFAIRIEASHQGLRKNLKCWCAVNYVNSNSYRSVLYQKKYQNKWVSRVAHTAHPIPPTLTSHQMQCEPVDVNSNVVTKAIISLDEAEFVVPRGDLLLRFSRFTI